MTSSIPRASTPGVPDADTNSVEGSTPKEAATSPGSLEDVTRKLAERLAIKGGTDEEWGLLAQSYEYMGRTDEARAARNHISVSRISGIVQIDPSLAGSAAPGTTLFVSATDATSPGPPLAVLRLRVDRWPVSFVLDDADAMIPGRNLSSSKRIQLEARISPTGDALPRPGDLVGQLQNVDPRTRQPVNISIDQKISG